MSSVDADLIEWLHDTAGGFMPKPRRRVANHQTLYQWRIHGEPCRRLLRQVKGYIKMERRRTAIDCVLRGQKPPRKRDTAGKTQTGTNGPSKERALARLLTDLV